MKEPKIIVLRAGFSNSILLVNGENSMLVDTGRKGILVLLKKKLRLYDLSPSDIKLIILTHTHYDHTGNIQEVKNFTGAKIVVHSHEREMLEKGNTPIPMGTFLLTKIISEIGRALFPNYAAPEPIIADIVVEEELNLESWKIKGKIVHTPGHTEGSVSVLIGKTLIAGDTFINLFSGSIFPPFANNPKQLLASWNKLFAMNIKEIYPGHGKMFHVKKAHVSYQKWNKKLG